MQSKPSALRAALLAPIRLIALLLLCLLVLPLLLTGSRYFHKTSGLALEPSKIGWFVIATFYVVVAALLWAIWFYFQR